MKTETPTHEVLEALRRAQRMLQAIAWDLEDGIPPEALQSLCACVQRAADDAGEVLKRATDVSEICELKT